jgi:hypothetical protein
MSFVLAKTAVSASPAFPWGARAVLLLCASWAAIAAFRPALAATRGHREATFRVVAGNEGPRLGGGGCRALLWLARGFDLAALSAISWCLAAPGVLVQPFHGPCFSLQPAALALVFQATACAVDALALALAARARPLLIRAALAALSVAMNAVIGAAVVAAQRGVLEPAPALAGTALMVVGLDIAWRRGARLLAAGLAATAPPGPS